MSRVTRILCLIFVPTMAFADPPELLPETSLRLQAARYSPTAPGLHWDTWIGGGTDLVRIDRATLSFQADVETTAGNTRRTFDATQANYHLEPALRVDLGGRCELTVFYHHVSRHEIDSLKVQAVDWNVLGLRAGVPLPEELGVPGRFTLGLGHTTQNSLVGYRWEIVGQVEADALRRPWGALYAFARARAVTAERSSSFPRDGFVDLVVEGGARWSRADKTLQLFVAYEHRNDVPIEQPGVEDRALFGLRLGLRSTTPAPGP
jgi:hypothetical protein